MTAVTQCHTSSRFKLSRPPSMTMPASMYRQAGYRPSLHNAYSNFETPGALFSFVHITLTRLTHVKVGAGRRRRQFSDGGGCPCRRDTFAVSDAYIDHRSESSPACIFVLVAINLQNRGNKRACMRG
jgi:hypothetical protein